MSGLEDRLLTLIKELQEEKRLADKRAKQLFKPDCAFLAGIQTTISNVTGDNSSYTPVWDTEHFDLGGNFLSTTFTAPVDGKYLFDVNIQLDDLQLDTFERTYMQLNTSNFSYYSAFHSGQSYDTGGSQTIKMSIIVPLDANDTVYAVIRVAGGIKTVNVGGSAGKFYSHFAGALLYKEN